LITHLYRHLLASGVCRPAAVAVLAGALAGCAPGARPRGERSPAREVVVTYDHGIGGPGPTVRITASAGGRVRGAVLLAAPPAGGADADDRARAEARRAWLRAHYGCAVFRPEPWGAGAVCAAPFPRGAPDWAAVLRQLDAAGVEAPPPPAEPPPDWLCSDGGGFRVAVRAPGRPPLMYRYDSCDPATSARAAHRDRLAAVLDAVLERALVRPLSGPAG
jgi:hypothetical protein